MNFTQPLPLSLYVHFPWCEQKCPYCDFNSHQAKASLQADERRYLRALVKQLEISLPYIWGRPIETIFFGGGTPSLMSVEGFDWLMSQFRSLLGLRPGIEINFEANPGSADAEKFASFAKAGVNRLSIGVQSFNNQHLQAIGRIHDASQAWSALQMAREAGIKRINLDLMFALPGQTLHQALADIERALEFAPEHISHYQLSIEPNTAFYRQPPVLPNDDLAWQMQVECQKLLAEAGYQHYEVSAYAKPNQACSHNLNYWQFGDYLGLGAGAHGKITLPAEGKILRTQMPASPGGYAEIIESAALTDQPGRWYAVEAEDLPFEFMLNALRLTEGFDLDLFAKTTGLDLATIKPKLAEFTAKNWITIEQNWLKTTELGQRYLNNLIEEFI